MRITETLQKENPFVLTAIDRKIFILRKDNPNYNPKKNDRVLSVDCVVANSHNLSEIREGIFEFLE